MGVVYGGGRRAEGGRLSPSGSGCAAYKPGVPPIEPAIVVAGGVFAGIVIFGLVVGLGTFAVRWMRLPADPPEAVLFEPPAPAPVPAGDPAAARARAAAHEARAGAGRRAYAVLGSARSSVDLADWIAHCDRERAAQARDAAGTAMAAADQARAAFTAGDAAALDAAELSASTAATRLAGLAAGLPDWRAAERRKLLVLSAALAAALALAAVATWVR